MLDHNILFTTNLKWLKVNIIIKIQLELEKYHGLNLIVDKLNIKVYKFSITFQMGKVPNNCLINKLAKEVKLTLIYLLQ